MKQSRTFIPTLREIPTEADITSHQLLMRAGFVRRHMNGVYSYLPLAQKVLRKIENIIREEMEAIDAVEIFLPALQQTELLDQSGCGTSDCSDLFTLTDRQNRTIALGLDHAGVMTTLLRDEVKTYKKLPLTLYQIRTLFKDEKRPRYGLIRLKEYMMTNAYSFHANQESLDDKRNKVINAYATIFSKLGLNVKTVIADAKSIDTKQSLKFMALSEAGEVTIAYSDSSTYAAIMEMAEVKVEDSHQPETLKEMKEVETPNQHTVEEVSAFLGIDQSSVVKTLIFKANDDLVAILLRGDHKINVLKLKKALGTSEVSLATETEIAEVVSCEIGYIGPVKLPLTMKVYADYAVKSVINGVSGANKSGYHLVNVNVERDFAVDDYMDLRFIQEGDPSPDGYGTIQFATGIDLGFVSDIGSNLSRSMNAVFIDEQGNSNPFLIGCYGLGISRLLAAVAEQYNDTNGLKWPKQLAPYDIHLVTVNVEDETQKQTSEEIYQLLTSYRYSILHDDRLERAGVKFADSDLIGLPMRLTIGKKAADGIIEVKIRSTGETLEWQREEITEKLQAYFG